MITACRDVGQKRLEPRAMLVGEGGADHHAEGEVRIALGAQRRQGDRLEHAKPFVEPGGVVEKGLAFGDGFMFDLKPAKRRVGKPAKPDHLHITTVHCDRSDCSCSTIVDNNDKNKIIPRPG